MEKERLFVIDGYGQIYRSYYAFMSNPLLDKEGNNVSAVFGFFTTLMSLIAKYKPQYLAVALDSKGKTFRHEMYPQYKANRAKTPEDLHAQIPVIKGILEKMNIPYFERQGMEADDIIATLSKYSKDLGLETVMVTGDKDLLQLVDDDVFALRPPRKGEHEYYLCKADGVQELFGVRPDQIIDYLTILGDSSDNVPGIDGIGEKGAVKLLTQWQTLKNAYLNIDQITGAVKTKLENARDNIELSHKLIELKNDVLPPEEANPTKCLTSQIDWANGVEEFTKLGSAKLAVAAKKFLPKDYAFNKVLEINSFSHTKFASQTEEKPQVPEDFDIQIAAWLLDSNAGSYTDEELFEKYQTQDLKELASILFAGLEERGLLKVYNNMEIPFKNVLAGVQKNGIMLNVSKMKSFEKDLTTQILELERDIYTVCGHPFNLNSPKQLQEVLFSERNLPTGKKTRSGFSTDSDVLEELAYSNEDPVPAMILRYRAMSKLLSTYVIPLSSLTDGDGRIHTTFVQTGTATGRLSCKNPNLQNIPVRTEEGRRIRGAFETPQGWSFISADYSQIELAVLASLSGDPELCRAFREGLDVHRETAALIFDIFPDLVTPEQRRIAKTINFGVIYGMSAFRLGKDLKIPRSQAQSFIDTYYRKYERIGLFMQDTIEYCKKNGYVKTLGGHIRAVPELFNSNKNIQALGERIAVNTVVQGTAAEIVKRAMIKVNNSLQNSSLKAKMILQVHDEIILEVPDSEVEQVKQLVENCMVNAAELDIPLRVGIESARCWGDMH